MSNSSSNDLLILAPIVAIFTIAISVAAALYYQGKSDLSGDAATSNNTVSGHSKIASEAPNTPITKYQNFSMREPFSEHVPFEFDPMAWMQMMNNMMENMQMTQMMHQMAAMPSQMLPHTMWVNPHAVLPSTVPTPSQRPMDPKDYKDWYEQQLKAIEQHKK